MAYFIDAAKVFNEASDLNVSYVITEDGIKIIAARKIEELGGAVVHTNFEIKELAEFEWFLKGIRYTEITSKNSESTSQLDSCTWDDVEDHLKKHREYIKASIEVYGKLDDLTIIREDKKYLAFNLTVNEYLAHLNDRTLDDEVRGDGFTPNQAYHDLVEKLEKHEEKHEVENDKQEEELEYFFERQEDENNEGHDILTEFKKKFTVENLEKVLKKATENKEVNKPPHEDELAESLFEDPSIHKDFHDKNQHYFFPKEIDDLIEKMTEFNPTEKEVADYLENMSKLIKRKIKLSK